jgi:TolB-like protein/DNA-binding winged helix-turn-helix (wHTH) protein
MSHDDRDLLEFQDYRIDAAQKLLLRGGEVVPLAPKVFDTLLVLVNARGRIVDKDDLLKQVWPGTFVEEGSLARNISTLRKVLGDDGGEQRLIETIPKRGYRIVAPIRELAPAERPSLPVTPARTEAPPQRPRRYGRIAVALAAVAAAGVVIGMSATQLWGPTETTIRSVAVLPLRSLSSDPADDFFADGTTESLISGLAQIHALDVTSRTSVMRFKGSTKPLKDIARELGVDAIVEGSVQRANGRIRESIQLIRASTDTHIWANEYDRDARDVLALQSEIARGIVEELGPRLTSQEATRLTTVKQVSPEAVDAFMLGKYHYWRNAETGLRKAIAYFDRAIALQPDYAAAYGWKAASWMDLRTFRDPQAVVEARNAATKALELDPDDANAHVAMGFVHAAEWEWGHAEREFRRALEIDPTGVQSCACYALILGQLDRIPEALVLIERARKTNPLSTQVEWNYGLILLYARRYEDAETHLRRAIELDPQNVPAILTLARTYFVQGRSQDAITLLDRPAFRQTAEMGIAYAHVGRRQDAEMILKGLEAEVDAYDAAGLSFALGYVDRGFERLGKALDHRDARAPAIRVNPQWDAVRSDPRFAALLKRLDAYAESRPPTVTLLRGSRG